jgi:hypothetical protein
MEGTVAAFVIGRRTLVECRDITMWGHGPESGIPT